LKGEVAVSTWEEDFAYSLRSVGAPHPGDLDAGDVYDLIESLVEGISISGKGATVARALAAAEAVEIVAVAGALRASWYVGNLIGAAIYASAKQSWDALTAPINLKQVLEWHETYFVPVLDLPTSEQPSWYAEVAHVEAAPPPPEYPGYEFKRGSNDADNVELIQRNLEGDGYKVKIDGIFGDETDRVVRQFQREHALKVDGIVGPSTWKILFTL
jgi:murein L,D-transpeptidase YcbB/YkuD